MEPPDDIFDLMELKFLAMAPQESLRYDSSDLTPIMHVPQCPV